MTVPRTTCCIALSAGLALSLLACDRGIDINKLRPDAHLEPVCMPGPEGEGGCDPVAAQLCQDRGGDWMLVLPTAAQHRAIQIGSTTPNLAAAAVDWEDSSGNVAGLVVSIPAASQHDVVALHASFVARIKGAGAFKDVRVMADGAQTRSHDGFPMVSMALLELTPASSTELHKIRNRLYPALLKLDITQFADLPTRPAETSDRFNLLLSTILRPDGRALVLGAVVTLDGFSNLLARSRVRATDLAGGTMVGRSVDTPRARCESLSFDAAGKLDMLWVVDGSDRQTMSDARIMLHGAASQLWNRARERGVDLRLAVVEMDQTKQVRLCRPKPSAECPDPGVGHFFGAREADLACFQACLLKPSGTRVPEASGFGLQSAKNTLLTLLARADDDPHKLRQGAQVAVVLASDVEDADVAQLFGGQVPDPLAAADVIKVMSLVQPLINLFTTGPASELGGTRAYALVVDPARDASCVGRRGTGYLELVTRMGGTPDSVCQSSSAMDALLGRRIDELAPHASQLVLQHGPVAATLQARLNGAVLFRSENRGFDYAPEVNALVLYGAQDTLLASGNRLELSYVGW